MTVAVVVKELTGVYGNDQATGVADIQDLVTDGTWTIPMILDAAAGTDYTYGSVLVPFNVQIISAIISPGAALTASDTVTNTYTLGKSDGAGGSITTVASYASTVANGNWVADTNKTMTLSATFANTLVNDGQLLTFKKTHLSTGTVTPASTLTVRYRKV